MTADATTAFLAFAALFAGLGLYLYRLHSTARRIEARLASLESATGKGKTAQREGAQE
ncbi:MAG: hypothetical protein ABR562_02080 [Thermoplasmatota archaeon]